MKKVIFIIAAILSTCTYGQAIHASFNPDKTGIGIIGEYPLMQVNQNTTLSVLASYETGTYHFFTYPCKVDKYGIGLKLDWFAAIYQYNRTSNADPFFFDLEAIKTHSLELGGFVHRCKHLGWGILYDVINNECRLTMSYNFNGGKK